MKKVIQKEASIVDFSGFITLVALTSSPRPS